MASQVSFSEEDFCCSVCHDIYQHPVLTPCGHSFCKACLQEWWRGKAKKQCPVCKETSRDAAPPPPCNIVLKNLCDTFREKQQQRQGGTEESDSDDSGDSFAFSDDSGDSFAFSDSLSSPSPPSYSSTYSYSSTSSSSSSSEDEYSGRGCVRPYGAQR